MLIQITSSKGLRLLSAVTATSFALCVAVSSRADTYTQDFDAFGDGETDFGDGSELITTGVLAGTVNGSLLLTDDTEGSVNTGFFIPGLGADQVDSFKLEFDYSLFDEVGGNPPADGFSVNVGPFTSADTGSEEGFGSGLAVEFDTWDNGGGENGHSVSVDGTDALDGDSSTLPIVDGEFHWVEIEFVRADANGGLLTVRVDDSPLFDAIEVDFVPEPDDIIGFAARTGGATETLLLDNLNLTAPAVLRNPRIAGDSELSFGLVGAGSTSAASLVIENRGASADLVISEAELTGADAASFTIDTPFPLTIPAGDSAMVMVTLNAGDNPGPKSARLELTNNDSAERARLRLVEISALVTGAVAGTARYQQDFSGYADGETDLGDGTEMFSTTDTAMAQGGALQLTDDAVGSTSAAFYIPGLGEPATQGWKASFDFLLYDAEGGNAPADGFSFNWGLIEPGATGSEEGFGTGLSVEFDTWDNGGGENGFNVAVDGADVPDGFLPGIPPVDGAFHHVEITWVRSGEDTGILTFLLDGEPVFEDLETPDFAPEEDFNFAFAARTGGATETLLIDNLLIDAPPPAVYEQDFNAFADGVTDLGDGTTLQSTPAGVTNVQGQALRLTDDATGSSSGAFFIPGLGVQQTTGFSADFQVLLFDEEGGNPPADGFSFNFGAIAPGATGSEEGFGTGLSVEFDTWDNGGGENGYNIAVDNVDVAEGFVNAAPPVDGQFHRVRIAYEYVNGEGTITLLLDGEPIFENLEVPGFEPSADFNFAFVGRTGGATETVLIDDLVISAPAGPAPAGDDPMIETPGKLSFGAVKSNSTGTATLTVSNLGATKDLTIESAAITGANAAAYSLITPLPVTIAPGTTADLELRVTVPDTAGVVEATLTLTNNDARERARQWSVSLLAAVAVPGVPYSQSFDSFDDDETDLGDGSIISSNDGVARILDGALLMTEDGTGSTMAAFKTPVLGDLSGGWSAVFDLAMEASGTPADGMSFNYGAIPDAGEAGEEGWNLGLTVSFDTYNNGGEGADTGIGLDVLVNGSIVEPEGGRLREPFETDDNGFYSNRFYTLDGEFRTVVIAWEPGGEGGFLTVSIGDETFYDRLPLPASFAPLPTYRFAWGARTGGAFETVLLDNIAAGPGGPRTALGIRFVEVAVNRAAGSASITWTSKPGATYIIEAGSNLVDWDELQDGYESGGEETTFQEDDLPAETVERYYRVREEEL